MGPTKGKRGLTVHPRVCGERSLVRLLDKDGSGSSPRVRGTRADQPLPVPPLRFIPACAGNAFAVAATSAPPPVHPRVCGERAVE